MATIEIRKIKSDLTGSAFDCGVAGINQMVRNSYFPTLLQHLYAYEVTANNTPVGYYMIGFRKIELSTLPDEIGELASDMSEYCYALHLKYIGVDRKYQSKGIGKRVLEIVIAQTMRLCEAWPIRLITLDALPERVEWYKSSGFKCIKETALSTGEIPMYFDCLLDREPLERYCS